MIAIHVLFFSCDMEMYLGNVASEGRRSHEHNAGSGLVGIKLHRDINLSGELPCNCENNPMETNI